MGEFIVAGRRYRYHDREEWQTATQPVKGPKPYVDLVHHLVIHWPGRPDSWRPSTDVIAYLRAEHAAYLRNKGFSYGYGFVGGPNPVDWNADPVVLDLWEVRGIDICIASNDGDNGWYGTVSNPNFNGRSNSLQIMSSKAFPADPDQLMTARLWVTWMDQIYGEKLEVIPHRTSDSTTCPGDANTAKIPLIATRVTAPPPPIVEEDDMFTDTDRAKLDAVYAKVMGSTPTTPTPTPPPTPTQPTPPPPDTSTWNTPEGTPAMRIGSTDANTIIPGVASEGRVSWLQAIHGRWPTTGVYDAQDVAKVKEHQRAGGITVDGVYGEQTEQLYKRWRGR